MHYFGNLVSYLDAIDMFCIASARAINNYVIFSGFNLKASSTLVTVIRCCAPKFVRKASVCSRPDLDLNGRSSAGHTLN